MSINNVHFFTRFVLLLLLMPLVLSCTSTSLLPTSGTVTSPTSTTAARPTETVAVTPTLLMPPPLGQVPQNCPPGPTPQSIFSDVGPAVGRTPLWAIGFDGPHAVIKIPPYFTYTPYGWTWKLIWRMQASYTYPIMLSGTNLHDGSLLWFQIDEQVPSTSPILDPLPAERHVPNAGSWIDWRSYLYIPVAGCYALEAKWPGGHWRITFAAGRQVEK